MEAMVQEAKDEADRNELLQWASARGLLADATELLRLGADASARNKEGRRAVHFAASHGHTDLLELFASHGVDVDAEDPRGRTPLHYAAAGGHADTVSFLLNRGVWVDSTDGADDSALHLAARGGHLACVRALLNGREGAAGGVGAAKTAVVNLRGLTPLGEAAVAGQVAVLECLAATGAVTTDARGRGGYSLLHLAAGLGHLTTAQTLLKMGCNMADCANDEGMSTLHAAAMVGDVEVVAALLKAGADPKACSADGRRPFDCIQLRDQYKPVIDTSELDLLSERPKSRYDDPAAEAKAAAAAAAAARAKLQKLLKVEPRSAAEEAKRARHAVAAGTGGRGTASDAEALLAQFRALSAADKIKKVGALAAMEPAALSALAWLPQGASTVILQARRLSDAVASFKAIAALRADEDFQEDIVDPHVKRAMEDMKATDDVEKYRNDVQVSSVSTKLRKLRAVLRMAGGMQVSLEDLLVAGHPANSAEATAQRLQALQATLTAALQAAVAAMDSSSAQDQAGSDAVVFKSGSAEAAAGETGQEDNVDGKQPDSAAQGDAPNVSATEDSDTSAVPGAAAAAASAELAATAGSHEKPHIAEAAPAVASVLTSGHSEAAAVATPKSAPTVQESAAAGGDDSRGGPKHPNPKPAGKAHRKKTPFYAKGGPSSASKAAISSKAGGQSGASKDGEGVAADAVTDAEQPGKWWHKPLEEFFLFMLRGLIVFSVTMLTVWVAGRLPWQPRKDQPAAASGTSVHDVIVDDEQEF